MSALSDFADRVDAQFTAIGNSVDGVQADVVALKQAITDLQNSPGAITPEDQARLNDIEAKAAALAAKVSALDDQTENPPQPS